MRLCATASGRPAAFRRSTMLLHVLRVVAMHGQHRILGDHHHGVLQADHGGQHAVAADVAVLGALQQHVAHRDVAAASLAPSSQSAPQLPTSDQPRSAGTTAARLVRSATA